MMEQDMYSQTDVCVPYYPTYAFFRAMKEIADYSTIDSVYEDEMNLKGSRFIGITMPCPDESCIASNLAMVSKKYPNATHYCYAAIFNGSERKERNSDNGEPSGTAGKPIQFVLNSTGMSDIMCIVVRYFGGTLLGTGGLVHAYTETSKLACKDLKALNRTACAVFTFTLDYPYYSAFESKCRDLMAKRPVCDYYEKVDIRAWIRMGDKEEFIRRIADVSERHARLNELTPEYI